MTRIFGFLTLIALLFTACVKDEISLENVQNNDSKTIIFTNAKNLNQKFSLSSIDYFQTAILIDDKGKKFDLKNIRTANGIMLVNDDGVELYFRKGEGYVKFGKNDKENPLIYVE